MRGAEELMLEAAREKELDRMMRKEDEEFEKYGDHSEHEDEEMAYWAEMERLEREGYDE